MNKIALIYITIALILTASVNVSAHRMGHGHGMMGQGMRGMMHMSMVRHHYVMRNGIGSEYASLQSILDINDDNIHAGEKLYEEHCSSCHGSSGYGDGPAGKDLDPPPANVARFSKMPMATDGYLFWTVSEGGIPVKSDMPAFKNTLTEEEIWKVILYLRDM